MTVKPPRASGPTAPAALTRATGDGVAVGGGLGDDVGVGLGVALAVAVSVGVRLGRVVGLGVAVAVGEGVGVALGEGDGAGVAVAVTVGWSVALISIVGVISSSSAAAVGVAVFALGGPTSPTGASSSSRYVGPPMIQPSISSAQRAPGRVN